MGFRYYARAARIEIDSLKKREEAAMQNINRTCRHPTRRAK